ncbi:heavy-metal-associated domain-containing protein [Oceanobacillus caeni]|uniref:Heavy metal-binding protein n=1 Tax=Oceanobacillus caeni TaxID=405946 RepID=A0ABR5MM40_9BACI|nr:heavy metal-associated domain-containing protein [Oceanobacillus caeni]KPH77474.1 heavy metal-binding protein [Oceanobacillus caeni]
MHKAIFELEPLTCPSCINNIEDTLNATKGIYSANVSFSSKMVETQFDETKIKAKEIEGVIRDLGYPVLSTK